MAHDHQYIEYGNNELPALFNACILTGVIIEIDQVNDQADVEIGGLGRINGVPVFYHCEGSATVEGGATAFAEDDEVIILNRTGIANPGAAHLQITGFADGLPRSCVTSFYLRPQIDGHTLIHGGQVFHLRYRDLTGAWVETPSRVIRGNQAGTEPEKYFYCGPFDISNWDKTSDVEVHLKNDKYSGAMSPGSSYRIINGKSYFDLNMNFYYYTADPLGDYQAVVEKDAYRISCANSTYMTRRMRVRHRMEYQVDFEDQTWMAHPDAPGTNALWRKIFPQRYSLVESLHIDFTSSEFLALLKNRETSIYDWGISEYIDNPVVAIPNLSFGLMGTSSTELSGSSWEDLFHGHYWYYDVDAESMETRRVRPEFSVNFLYHLINFTDDPPLKVFETGEPVDHWNWPIDPTGDYPRRWDGAKEYNYELNPAGEPCYPYYDAVSLGADGLYNGKNDQDIQDLFTQGAFIHLIEEPGISPTNIYHTGTLVRDFGAAKTRRTDPCGSGLWIEDEQPLIFDPVYNPFSVESVALDEPYF